MNPIAKELAAEKKHTFESLVRVMQLLREPGGCPWDREQTHESIRGNFIEETYEVIEAIDTADAALLREELGDVLMQVVFHARISEESGDFTVDDVIDEVTEKLIRRHPHVFGDVQADTSEAVLVNWENIKKEEKHRVGLAGSLLSVPPSLPALMRAQKLMKKAGKAEIHADPSLLSASIRKTAEALADALANNEDEKIQDLSGRMAFLTVAAAQIFAVDTEERLYHECNRFTRVLTDAEAEKGEISDLTPDERCYLAKMAYFFS